MVSMDEPAGVWANSSANRSRSLDVRLLLRLCGAELVDNDKDTMDDEDVGGSEECESDSDSW